jgi:hypothetical protein
MDGVLSMPTPPTDEALHAELHQFRLLRRNLSYDTQVIEKLRDDLTQCQQRQSWQQTLLRPELSEEELLRTVGELQTREQQLRDLLQIHQAHHSAMLTEISLIAAV